MTNYYVPLALAVEALDALDGVANPSPDLVRLARAAGPQKFHNEVRRTLLSEGWKRGNSHKTAKELATSPWLSPWGDLVVAQVDAITALTQATVDLSHPKAAEQAVDPDEQGLADVEGADNE